MRPGAGDERAREREIQPSPKDVSGRAWRHGSRVHVLTRGDLARESESGVSRGRSSEETPERAWSEGPKEPFTRRGVSGVERTVFRNQRTQQLRQLSVGRPGQVRWIPHGSHAAGGQQDSGRPPRATVTREGFPLWAVAKPPAPTAGCGRPHVRWCGRGNGRNPVTSTRSRFAEAHSHSVSRTSSGAAQFTGYRPRRT